MGIYYFFLLLLLAPLHSMELPESLEKKNIALDECIELEKQAMSLDTFYQMSRSLLEKDMVHYHYLAALQCFLKSYKKDTKNPEIMVHLHKLHLLLLANQTERTHLAPHAPRSSLQTLLFSMMKKNASADTPTDNSTVNSPSLHESFGRLARSMHQLVDPLFLTAPKDTQGSYLRRNSLDDHSCRDLYNATVLLTRTQTLAAESKKNDIEIQEIFRQAIDIFISVYNNKCYKAFPYLSYTLKDIIEFEERHSGLPNTLLNAHLLRRLEMVYKKESVKRRDSFSLDRSSPKRGPLISWQEFLKETIKENLTTQSCESVLKHLSLTHKY